MEYEQKLVLDNRLTRKIYEHRTKQKRLKTGLIPPTLGPSNYSAQQLDMFVWCDRLSRLLVGFRTHFKSLHFHFISFHSHLLDENSSYQKHKLFLVNRTK